VGRDAILSDRQCEEERPARSVTNRLCFCKNGLNVELCFCKNGLNVELCFCRNGLNVELFFCKNGLNVELCFCKNGLNVELCFCKNGLNVELCSTLNLAVRTLKRLAYILVILNISALVRIFLCLLSH
jgi:hypothetical protein